MIDAANLPLLADRYLVFNEQIAFFGVDFTGATYLMEISQVADRPAILSLTTTTSSSAAGVRLVYAGSDTLPNHVAADRITQAQADAAKAANGYADADSVALSILNLRVLAATMGLASYPAPETGDDLDLVYALMVTLPGGDQEKYAYGAFTVRGTA